MVVTMKIHLRRVLAEMLQGEGACNLLYLAVPVELAAPGAMKMNTTRNPAINVVEACVLHCWGAAAVVVASRCVHPFLVVAVAVVAAVSKNTMMMKRSPTTRTIQIY